MILRCINNNLCDSLTLNKEYYVIEETSDYYVVIDDSQNETTCKKSRFTIVEDNDLSKKCKATINELSFQLEKILKVKLRKLVLNLNMNNKKNVIRLISNNILFRC